MCELSNNPHIVNKKIGKGSAVVIQSTEQYLTECFKQLSNGKYYILEIRDLTQKHNAKVHKLVDSIHSNGSISEKRYRLFEDNEPKCSCLQHITKNSQECVPPPGKPILSANDAPP